MRLHIDPDNMTIGDLEDFEGVAGRSFDKVLSGTIVKDEDTGEVLKDENGRPLREVSMRAVELKALIWVTQRKTDPAFTLEDARNVKVTDLAIESDDDEADAGKDGSAPA